MIDIVIMRNPLGKWNPEEGDRQTEFAIDWDEVEEIQNLIGVPPLKIKDFENEDFENYQKRLKEEYQKIASQKGYKMLGRIWYYYHDAVYQPSEITRLKAECLEVIKKTKNADLIAVMNKILATCDDALKTNSGLFFGCD